MGLEMRSGRPYYYRKRRIGGRVVSVYEGGGDLGAISQYVDWRDRIRASLERAEWRERREELDAEESRVAGAIRDVDRSVGRGLEAAGYHRPSRKLMWLRKGGPGRCAVQKAEVPAVRPGPTAREVRDTIALAATVGHTSGGAALGIMGEFRELVARHPDRVAEAAEVMGVDPAAGPVNLIVDELADSLVTRDAWARFATADDPEYEFTGWSADVARAVILARLRALHAELAGPDPTPAEWHLAGAAALAWLDYQRCLADRETLPEDAPVSRASYFDARADRAHRRFVRSVKALAAVRKLPAVPIRISAHVANVAQQQINGQAHPAREVLPR